MIGGTSNEKERQKKGDIFEMVVPLVVVDYVHLNHDTLQSFFVAIYVSNQPIKYHLPPSPPKNETSSGRLYMGGRLV